LGASEDLHFDVVGRSRDLVPERARPMGQYILYLKIIELVIILKPFNLTDKNCDGMPRHRRKLMLFAMHARMEINPGASQNARIAVRLLSTKWSRMKLWFALLTSILLAACASAPLAPRPETLFEDALFRPAAQPIRAADVLALSEAMKRFLDDEIVQRAVAQDPRQLLFDALYKKGGLRLDYDSAKTRNAAEAFAARSGNCLSLVLMTAAFAGELGLPVRFQQVIGEETWSRSGSIQFTNGHVNISLGRKSGAAHVLYDDSGIMTIDFLPPQDLRGLHWRVLGEETVIAMYMNNRAAEALADEQFDDAYAWAHQAIIQDPKLLDAYNTLGVVFRRHGNPRQAERVFNYVLDREPANVEAISNLGVALNAQGRFAEAEALSSKLKTIQPYPPFHFFDLGIAAMRQGDFAAARDWFVKEVDRAAYNHEFHFWLALAYASLGDTGPAKQHLALAVENSTTRKDHDLYAAKLAMVQGAGRKRNLTDPGHQNGLPSGSK
jgi:tetratricopeptide (TPR) repeat protein